MKIAIHTPTESEFNELMQYLEERGYLWRSLQAPTEFIAFRDFGSKTVIKIDTNLKQISCDTTIYETASFAYSDLKTNNFKIEIQL